MKIRHSNAYAAITVLVLVAMLFIGMYAMMDPFARIFSMFADPEDAVEFPTELKCTEGGNHWYGGACYDIPERARGIIFKQRRVWLVAPIIFVIGLIFWYITASTRKDPYYFQQGGPPSGGFK